MADELPLILLSKLELPELVRSFSIFLEQSEDVFAFREHSQQHVEVNFCGVRFSCMLATEEDVHSDSRQIMLNSDLSDSRASLSIGFSELVNSSLPIMPLVKTLLELASKFAASLPVSAIVWVPAKTACGPEFFKNSVSDFVAGGAFPSLSLVRFELDGQSMLRTNGLAWFSNQEIEIDAGDLGENEAVRRLVRIIHDIVANGAIAQDMVIGGLKPDEKLSLSVSAEEKLVRVRTMSKMDL